MSSGADNDTLLEVKDLKTWFPIRSGLMRKVTGHVRAVDGVSLEIRRGETFALVGESGCGKTTVGRSILQLLGEADGEVLYNGENILRLSRRDFRPIRKDLQIILQDPASALDPRMTVRDSIAEGIEAFELASGHEATTRKFGELMEAVSLDPDAMYRYPHEFSGGQRQRICIARALAVEPKLIICDEAVSALDVSIQAQILNLLRRLQKERGLTYLFITHDLSVVRYLADRVAIMYLGRIVEQGSTTRIFDQPHHPYTQALLAAIPSIDPDRRGAAPQVMGDVPSPTNPPSGCHYHPRCPQAMPACRTQVPPWRELGPPMSDGASRCFLDA